MSATPSRVGQSLDGKYRLEALLGAGGMGEVYRATHLVLGRSVAIKLLKPELAHYSEVVARFLREAKASSMVRHRNVVEVIDVGSDADGTPYIVQEHLEGEDFSSLLERHPEGVPPSVAMSVLLPIVDAVAAAHEKGVVHRDLKPENVFLAREGGVAVPKVLDFGISKLPELDDRSTRLTAADALMGSPQYMSPEQIQTPRDVDRRSDIWSLGVMLFECLSGRLPFDASTPERLFIQICRGRPLLLDEVAPHLPAELASVVARCMESDPAKRFQSAVELRDALKQLRARPSLAQRAEPRAAGARAPAAVTPEPPPSSRAAVGAGFGTRVDEASVAPPSAQRAGASAGFSTRVDDGVVEPLAQTQFAPRDDRADVDATKPDPVAAAPSPARTAIDPEVELGSRPSRPDTGQRATHADRVARTVAAATQPGRRSDPRAEPPPTFRSGTEAGDGELEPELELEPIGVLDGVLAALVILAVVTLVPAIRTGHGTDAVQVLGNARPLWGLGVAAALVLGCTRTAMLALDARSFALFAAALGLLVLPGCFVILSTALGWPRAPLAARAPLALAALPWASLAVCCGFAAHAARRAALAARHSRWLTLVMACGIVLGCAVGGYRALFDAAPAPTRIEATRPAR